MRDALRRSGYLLESRIAALLRKRDYRVASNSVFPDPLTGKSRELDIHAQYMRIRQIGPSQDEMLWPEFIIECVHPPQPIAFVTYPRPDDFLSSIRPTDTVRLVGQPIHTIDDSLEQNWFWLLGVMGLKDKHHYAKGIISTQFCSFEQKRGTQEWMATHRDEDYDAFAKLCRAVDHHILDYYRTMTDSFSRDGELQIGALHPVMVVDGELVEIRAHREPIQVKRANHVRYYRTDIVGGKSKEYVIDVVTEKYFGRYLAAVEHYMDVLANRIADRHSEVVEHVKGWLEERNERLDKTGAGKETFLNAAPLVARPYEETPRQN